MSVSLPEWFSILRKDICHRTGLEGLKNIMDTGGIRPNDGTFPDTYPQSKQSYARVHHYVSLFDFKTQTDDECLSQIHNWYRFFFDRQPVTIVILLERKFLAPKLISNEKAVQDTKGTHNPIFLPFVEVFYPEPIPCDAVTGYLIICGVYERLYEYIPHAGAFPGIFSKIDDFIKKHQDIYLNPLGHLEKDLGKND